MYIRSVLTVFTPVLSMRFISNAQKVVASNKLEV